MLKTTNLLRNFSIKLISGSSQLVFKETMLRDGINIEKCLKYFVLNFLILVTFCTHIYADKEDYYRFSPDIYDQSKVLQRKSSLSEDKLNKELQEELLRRKKEELGKNFVKRINESIATLEEELRESSKGKLRESIIEVLKSNTASLPLVGMLTGGAIGSAAGPVGTLIGLGTGIVAGTVAAVGAEFLKEEVKLNKEKKYQRDPQEIINRMAELKEKRAEFLAGLECEPIDALESAYVIKKRHMTDSGLQAEIERSLIQARVADYYFQLNSPTIGYALGLPFGPKSLLDSEDRFRSKGALLQRFEQDTAFSIYSDNIRKALLKIITQIATNSITSTSNSPLRAVEHFLGKGSTGKSTAAKEIARFLGLPYFEKRITSPETEISMTNISGSPRSFQGSASLGWLADALLLKKGKESYQNTFLILDDFAVNTQNGQNLLLSITDPEKKTFFNEYFQADLNISRLNIIIISNEDFKCLTPENKATFEALKSRFETTQFPEFDERQKGILAKPYLEEGLVRKYSPPFFYRFRYVDPTQFEVSYDMDALQVMGLKKEQHRPVMIRTGVSTVRKDAITVRELKRVLEDTVNRSLNNLLQNGIKHFNLYKGNNNIRDLKMAAMNGHPEAINILVQQNLPQDPAKRKEVLRKVAEGHKKNGNLVEAKKLWIKSFELEDWDVWPQVSKHLSYNPKGDDDKQFVKHLLTFTKKHDKRHKYAEEIGDHLYQIGLHVQNGSEKVHYFEHSAKLENQHAAKSLEEEKEKLKKNSFMFKVLKKEQAEYHDKGSLGNIFGGSPLDICDLAQDLKYTSALTSLTIECRNLGDEGIRPLCKALNDNNSLTSINLSYSWITDEGVSQLGKALKGKTRLQQLTLHDIWASFSKKSVIKLSMELPGVRLDTCHGRL